MLSLYNKQMSGYIGSTKKRGGGNRQSKGSYNELAHEERRESGVCPQETLKKS